jgi:PAS domain-containing protein
MDYDYELITDIITLLGTVLAVIVFLWKIFKFTNKVLLEQESVKKDLQVIKKEVTPNSGSSIKDIVTELRSTTSRIEIRQKKLDQRSKAALHYTSAALFEIDSSGRIIWGNELFIKMTGSSIEGLDWFSIVDENFRKDFIEEVTSCLKMGRKIDIETQCYHGKRVHFLGHPYKIDDLNHEGYLVQLFKGE